jgi:tetratricopeptide (TPR) repeat protein
MDIMKQLNMPTILMAWVLIILFVTGCTNGPLTESFDYAYYDRGMSYDSIGQYQRALKDRKPADRFDPNNADDYYNRGLAYFSEGQNDKAISDYNRAIEINPKHAAAYYNRGLAHFDLGNQEFACNDWRKACELGVCKGLNLAGELGFCQ